MKLPSVALALVLSLVGGIAVMRLAVVPIDADAAERSRQIESSCDGYDALHVLLRSARQASEFRRYGRCREVLQGLNHG